MPKFLDPDELNDELYQLFYEAEKWIIIVCPYIKLPKDLKQLLESKKHNSDFHLLLLFGKNEFDISKSLNSIDFEFFKGFQNLTIRYHQALHAKYYANESKSIITSMNLHNYSIKNNIEVGVLFERSFLNFGGGNTEDDRAFAFFQDVFDTSEEFYDQTEIKKSSFFGMFKKKIGHVVNVDNSEIIYDLENRKNGFCIRTGVKIEFNFKMPLSRGAFERWSHYADVNYPEQYCHFSGEKSYGKTSFAKPVLLKNWRHAMEKFGIKY
jgi:hypothetical protein